MVWSRGVARPLKRKGSSLSPSASKKRPFDRLLHKSMITIRVGSGFNEETFVMHKELVAHHSTKLARMMNDIIKVENPGILELPDFVPADFQIFEAWLYRQQLEDEDRTFLSSASLCIFAEEVGSSGLMNAILEAMGQTVRDDPEWVSTDSQVLNMIWDNTLLGSPLRTLVADVLAFEMTAEDFCQQGRKFPVDLTIRILEAMKRRVPGRMKNEVAPFDFSMEHYYVKEAE
ncbi:hypothetical protein MMC17_000826 [Xylographa soralifera]|nr:hypothetical protein [Xylographa soralifera]